MTASRDRLSGLDALRGAAALGVLLFHARGLVLPRSLLTHGYLAVDLFFILSGFLISRQLFRALATHGTFSWASPRQSALALGGGERLTIGHLLDNGGANQSRLVVLSACETGVFDFQRAPDEFVGLPLAFLQAGAAGVIGSGRVQQVNFTGSVDTTNAATGRLTLSMTDTQSALLTGARYVWDLVQTGGSTESTLILGSMPVSGRVSA